ncbi:MAG: hypothetical protein QM783_19415 [Phycisphaerales bacterium]
MPAIPPWLWITTGWTLIALGLWVGVRGRLRWIRLHNRRCRKCGYCVDGLPSLMCPECGRVAKHEREWTHRRRLKRWRIAGALLLLAGWFGTQAPAITERGLAAAVPGPLLAALAPMYAEDPFNTLGDWDMRWPQLKPPPWRDRIEFALYAEVQTRLVNGTLGGIGSNIYLRRLIAPTRPQRLPDRWPWDARLERRGDAYARNSLSWRCKPCTGPTDRVEVQGVIYSDGSPIGTFGQIQVAIDASDDRLHFLTHVNDDATNAAVLAALRPRLQFEHGTPFIHFDDRTDNPVWSNVPRYTDFTVRVMQNDRVLGEGWCYVDSSPGAVKTIGPVMRWNDGGREAVSKDPNRVEIILTGAPARSTDRSLEHGRTEKASAWSGTARVVLPLEQPAQPVHR